MDTGNVGQYKYTTTSYTTSSPSGGGGGRQSPHPSHPSYPMPPEKADPVPAPVRTPSQPPPPQPQPQPQPPRDGTPTGVAYYSKYHSSQTHSSSNRHYGGSGPPPASFPGGTSPAPPRSNAFAPQQTPPKRVDQLMTELSEFDSSIQDTRFVEPIEQQRRDPSPEPYRPYRESSPERPPKQQSTPGPAVYYPPGEMFTTTTRTQQVYTIQSHTFAFLFTVVSHIKLVKNREVRESTRKIVNFTSPRSLGGIRNQKSSWRDGDRYAE